MPTPTTPSPPPAVPGAPGTTTAAAPRSGRLPNGELRRQVAEVLTDRAGTELTPRNLAAGRRPDVRAARNGEDVSGRGRFRRPRDDSGRWGHHGRRPRGRIHPKPGREVRVRARSVGPRDA